MTYRKPYNDMTDEEMQQDFKDKANYSLAVLGESCVRYGSGRFLNLPAKPKSKLEKKLK